MNFDNKLLRNAGSLENKGFEVAVTGRPIQTKDWFVELSVNAAYNKNKITDLASGYDMIATGMEVGQNEKLTYHKVECLQTHSTYGSRFTMRTDVQSWVATLTATVMVL